MLVMKLQSS